MKAKEEDIRYFINVGYLEKDKIKILWTFYFLYAMVAIPLAILGIKNGILKNGLLVEIVLVGIGVVYLSTYIDRYKIAFLIFVGFLSLSGMTSCLVAGLKVLSLVIRLNYITVSMIIVLYTLLAISILITAKRKIEKGYNSKNVKNPGLAYTTSIGLTVSIIVITVMKSLKSNITQLAAKLILAGCLIIYSLLMLVGVVFFQKAYYAYILEKIESKG